MHTRLLYVCCICIYYVLMYKRSYSMTFYPCCMNNYSYILKKTNTPRSKVNHNIKNIFKTIQRCLIICLEIAYTKYAYYQSPNHLVFGIMHTNIYEYWECFERMKWLVSNKIINLIDRDCSSEVGQFCFFVFFLNLVNKISKYYELYIYIIRIKNKMK